VLDGEEVARVDAYSPTEQAKALLYRRKHLGARPHELYIEWTGDQNEAANGTAIPLDYLVVDLVPDRVSYFPRISRRISRQLSNSSTWSPTSVERGRRDA